VTIAADRDPRFRRYLEPGSFNVQDKDIATAVRLMGDISRDDFRDAGDAFCELLASEQRRSSTGIIRLLEEAETLSEKDFFQVVPNLMCSLSQKSDTLELTALGRSIEFPLSAQADLELCLTGKVFRIADINGVTNHGDRIQFVRRLLLEGVIQKLGYHDDKSPRLVDFINHISSAANVDLSQK
jgi:hypothetical protein